ncbi:DMT family transporter [Aestuariibius sp. 2305UL40-4]|uniref:DMT family transporter n=1 Tax=Aestuariibius violaceus TaxID=3234132 RepID=UPI00345E3C36
MIGAGACLGLSTNIAKIASDTGLAPLPLLAWSVLGATVILGGVAAARGQRPAVNGRTAEYFVIAAFFTLAGSNLTFFSAVPHVGASFVALAITLPPLLTYLGALCFRMERFNTLRAAGVLAALIGAGVLAVEQFRTPDAPALWVILTLVGPVFLAIGNLYRSLRWPPGESAEALAPGLLGASAAMFFALALLPGFSVVVPADRVMPFVLIGAQTVVFAAQFLLLFILQRSGGPVLLSLLGGVGALVAVPVAILLLDEAPPGGLFLGAALIAAGIALVSVGGAQARKS